MSKSFFEGAMKDNCIIDLTGPDLDDIDIVIVIVEPLCPMPMRLRV